MTCTQGSWTTTDLFVQTIGAFLHLKVRGFLRIQLLVYYSLLVT